MLLCRVFPASRLSLSLSLSLLCAFAKKKTNRTSTNACATLKRHISIILEHGGFHGETTTFAKTTTTLATMRLSRASRGRRARAFDGRFRKCAPSAHFFFSVSIRARWIRGRKRAVVPSLLVVTEFFFCRFRKGTRNAWTRRLTNAFSSFSRVRTPTVIFRWPFCQGTFSRRFYLRRRLSLGRLEVCALFLFFFRFFFLLKEREGRITRLRYRSSDDVLRLILIPLPRLTLSPSLSLFSSANNSNASRKKSPLAKTKRRPECPRSSKRLA